MSAGLPASVPGSNFFTNLPHSSSNSSSSVAALLQQHQQQQVQSAPSLATAAAGIGYGSAYPPPPPSNAFLGNPYFAAAAAAAAAAAGSSSSSLPSGPSPLFNAFLNSTSSPSEKQQQHNQRIKLKRTRQRVDAGEPRNTYSSFIPAYQKVPPIPPFNATGAAARSGQSSSSEKLNETPTTAADFFATAFLQQNPNNSYVQNLLRGMHLQQQAAAESNVFRASNGGEKDWMGKMGSPDDTPSTDAINGESNGDFDQPKRTSTMDRMEEEDDDESSPPAKKRARSCDADDLDDDDEEDTRRNGSGLTNGKKTAASSPTCGSSASVAAVTSAEVTANRSKRKQYQPQQLDVKTTSRNEEEHGSTNATAAASAASAADPLLLSMTTTDFENSDDNEESDGKSLSEPCDEDEDEEQARRPSKEKKRDGMNDDNEMESGDEALLDGEPDDVLEDADRMDMQKMERMQNLVLMHQRYVEMLAASQQQQQHKQQQRPQQKEDGPAAVVEKASSETKPPARVVTNSNGNESRGNTANGAEDKAVMKEVKSMSEALKTDLYTSVCTLVDEYVERMQKCIQAEAARLHAAQLFGQQQQLQQAQQQQQAAAFGRGAGGGGPMPPWASQLDAGQRAPAPNPMAPVGQALFGPPPPPPGTNPPSQENQLSSSTGQRPQFYFNPFYYHSFPYASAGLNFAAAAAAAAASGQQAPQPPPGFLSSPTGTAPNTATPSSTIFPSFPASAPPVTTSTPNAGGNGSTTNLTNQTTPSPYMGLNLSHKNNGSGSTVKNGLDDASPGSASLPMPRKKRSKVTDTRVTKLNFRTDDLGQLHAAAAAAAAAAHQLRGSPASSAAASFFSGAYPPTLLPPHLLNPHHHQHQSPFGSGMAGALTGGGGGRGSSNFDDSDLGAVSPDNSDGTGSEMTPYDPNMPQSSTLTPMHLRKAKLMFFYTRYPSSALLKAYFPDIRFNKNNTAQLVKWFSNFREFYYIQMEKYARQALAEGIKTANEIYIGCDSELYKQLNLHYNRNNHIQVPPNFRSVVEATLKEFFVAVQANRDAEPSWKKAIYKVIARMDDPIPDYFKTPNFLEQLE